MSGRGHHDLAHDLLAEVRERLGDGLLRLAALGGLLLVGERRDPPRWPAVHGTRGIDSPRTRPTSHVHPAASSRASG